MGPSKMAGEEYWTWKYERIAKSRLVLSTGHPRVMEVQPIPNPSKTRPIVYGSGLVWVRGRVTCGFEAGQKPAWVIMGHPSKVVIAQFLEVSERGRGAYHHFKGREIRI